MREILFRGKAIDGNWYYGVPLIFTEDYVCMTAPHTYNKKVEANTIGQFTGLTDKNGTKIFEGDICKDFKHKSRFVNIFNTNKKYNIIYADPPWTYEKTGGLKNSRGMAKQFYKTMSIDDIKGLPIKNIANDNCVLFLWCTYPQLQNGLDVIKAWGFEYFGLGFEWIKKTKNGKDFFGMGYWTRANPECCLLAIKGKPKPKSHAIRQLVYSEIQEHSRKPDIIREKIIELCGDLPRIELFARQQIDNWDCWGDEC